MYTAVSIYATNPCAAYQFDNKTTINYENYVSNNKLKKHMLQQINL